MDSFLPLFNHLQSKFNVIPLRNYTSNVYVTRLEIWEALQKLDPRPDYVLWLDDDNLATPDQVDLLFADLDAHPEFGVVAGWCWVHDREQKHFQVSAGHWSFDGSHWRPFDPMEFPTLQTVQPAEVTGFPCVLMRGSVLGQLGPRPFLTGILDERLPFGIGGEDLAFCRACRDASVRIGVDPEVRVQHLKWMEVIPEFTGRVKPSDPPKVAVMIRARNEARWIGRAVRSVKDLGPVLVMDDHSTDRTWWEAEQAGAVVEGSPFVGDQVDEARDKEWLLSEVKRVFGAIDWVLCIDGDEELERGGVAKLQRALTSGSADVYALRILYLWDSPTKVRLDGQYGQFGRFSLFRIMPGQSFGSLWKRRGFEGTNEGLHVGNAPLAEGFRGACVNVTLLHYGYMHKADRLRKYEYYNRIDPNNEAEDCYRHLVQGDIPEVPAEEKLVHGGPLDVRELPASLAPEGWQNSTSASEDKANESRRGCREDALESGEQEANESRRGRREVPELVLKTNSGHFTEDTV